MISAIPLLLLLSAGLSAAEEVQIDCGSTGCREGVGLIVVRDSPGSGRGGVTTCTGFLVSSRITATNSHCIPNDIKANPGACGQRISVYFPGRGGRVESVARCGRLVGFSDISGAGDRFAPDVAFLELAQDRPERPLQVDFSGFADGQSVAIPTFRPLSDRGIQRAFSSLSCRAVHRSLFGQDVRGDVDPMVLLGDCDVVQGMSGSPLLDAQGKVRGVVAQANTSYGSALNSAFFKPIMRDSVTRFSIGTNFSCVPLPVQDQPGRVLPPACSEFKTRPPARELRLLVRKADLDEAVQRAAADEAAKLDKRFRWVPRAVPVGSWGPDPINKLSDRYTLVPLCRMGNSEGKPVPLALPVLDIDYDLNRYLQAGFLVRKREPVPSVLEEDAYGLVVRVLAGPGKQSVFAGSLSLCEMMPAPTGQTGSGR